MKHILIKCTNRDNAIKLIPQVLLEKGYDIIDLFVVDSDRKLINYAEALEKTYPKKIKFHIYPQDTEIHDKDLIAKEGDYYIALNEMTCFIESGTFTALFKKKEENPDYFLITPLMVNNWLGCYVMQQNKKYNFKGEIEYVYTDSFNGNDFISTNGLEAEFVHRSLIDTYRDKNGKLTTAHCKDFEFCSRTSLDCVCWSGSDMKILLDEYEIFNAEPFFTYQYPISNDRKCLMMGSKITAKYSTPLQEDHLKNTGLRIEYDAIFYNRIDNNKTMQNVVRTCDELINVSVNGKLMVFKMVDNDIKYAKTDTCEPIYLDDELKGKRKADSKLSDTLPYMGILKGVAHVLEELKDTNVEYVGLDMSNGYWDMTEDEIVNALGKFDIVMPNTITKTDMSKLYSDYHSTIDFELLSGVIKEYFPIYYDTWKRYMYSDGNMGFIRNAMLCRKNTFIDLWTFVFDVIYKFREVFNLNTDAAIQAHVRMFSRRSAPSVYGDDWIAYQQKMFQYMAERLVTLYVYRQLSDSVGLGEFVLLN